jgi:multiple sugar transport system substrate-binding protein
VHTVTHQPNAAHLSRRGFLRTVTFAAGAVLTGCGSSDDEPSPGRIRLTQWYHQYGEEHAHEAAIRYAREYTVQNPHIEIKVVWVPGDYMTKLSTGLIGGRGPDIFEANLSSILGSVAAGLVLPLDDLLSGADRQDFAPSCLAMNTFKGKLYGIPEVIDACVLYYRPSVLQAAGLQPPQTVDELIAASKALTSTRTKGLFVGNDGGMTALFNVVPWSAGADFLVDGKIVFDTPSTAAAFEKIKELYDSGSLLIGAPTDWWVPAAFTENLAAMQWTGLWALKDITEAFDEDVGILPWPAFSRDSPATPVTPLSGWAAFINANGPHADEAKKFVRWLWIDNKKDQQDWCTSYGVHIPPRISVAAAAPLLATGRARDVVALAQQYGRIWPPTWTTAMQTSLLNALARIVREDRPAANEIHLAAERCATELNDQASD